MKCKSDEYDITMCKSLSTWSSTNDPHTDCMSWSLGYIKENPKNITIPLIPTCVELTSNLVRVAKKNGAWNIIAFIDDFATHKYVSGLNVPRFENYTKKDDNVQVIPAHNLNPQTTIKGAEQNKNNTVHK